MGRPPRIQGNPKTNRPAGIYIDHPGDKPVPASFAAFGRADRIHHVFGLLTDAKGNVLAVGRTLAHAPCWAIDFPQLKKNSKYTLWVFEVPRIDRPCNCFEFAKQDFSTGDIERDFVTITYPTGGTVPTTFTAYGSTDQVGQVMGEMDGPDTYPGTVLQGPPDWRVQFTGLQAATPYTLGIIIGNDNQIVYDLTVV